MSEIEPSNNNATLLSIRREQQQFAHAVRDEVGVIAGVDDRIIHRYRFPRLGKIHIGEKTQNERGTEYPRAVDYFVLPEYLLQDQKFLDVLAQHNADPRRPRVLPIQLPSNNIADNIRSSLDYYGANRGLKCRSWDGINAQCVNDSTGEIEDIKCLNRECVHFVQGECQIVTRLRFFLPDARGIGVWQIDTRSINNRVNLPCEMGTIRASAGQLAGLDLLLTLEPETITRQIIDKTGKTSTIKSTVWLLHIRSNVSMRELRNQAQSVNVNWSISDVEEPDTSYDEIVMGNAPSDDEYEPAPNIVQEPEPEPVSYPQLLHKPNTNSVDDIVRCARCGEKITDGLAPNGKRWTRASIIKTSTKRLGQPHCAGCTIELMDTGRIVDEQYGPDEDDLNALNLE